MKMKTRDVEEYIRKLYDVEVPDYWDRIESAIKSGTALSNSMYEEIETDKANYFPYYRIIAAAVCLVLIITASVLAVPRLFSGPSGQSHIAYGEDTPVRTGRLGSMQASFEKPYTFREAYEEANLVAEIVITGWLGELDREGFGETTYFKALITEEYKNSIHFQEKEIVLLQSGNSKWTHKGYPLFKNGDRFLLFLSWVDPNEYPAFSIEGKDCFAIIGSQITEMQIVEQKGTKYVLKRNLFQNFTDIGHLMKPDSTGIIKEALKKDSVLSQTGTKFECVYSMDDLKSYMEGLGKGDGNE